MSWQALNTCPKRDVACKGRRQDEGVKAEDKLGLSFRVEIFPSFFSFKLFEKQEIKRQIASCD